MAAAKHIELPAVIVPSHLWMRSTRPLQGRVVHLGLAVALVAAGLLASGLLARVGLVLAGIATFAVLPQLVLARLEKLGLEVQSASAKQAAELLQNLPQKPVVRLFAPHAWLRLQEAVLQLKCGDGKAAATNFAETARLVSQPGAVMLLSAQAHALVTAGERSAARELLQRLAHENLLGSRDQLDLGIVLLVESKKNKQALAYIEAARKTIGDHPRVLAAMALALQKTERIDEASELLEQVQISLQGAESEDPVVEDLVKRARKGLQNFIEAQLRRERRSRSRRTTIVVSSDVAASEIVSGEIGAADQAQLDNPTTGFRPVDASPSVISSKSVGEELGAEERSRLNLPEHPSRQDSGFSIDSSDSDEPEEDAPQPAPTAAPVVVPTVVPASPTSETGSLVDSVLTALTSEPSPVPQDISLINPVVAAVPASTVTDPSKVLEPLPPAPTPVAPPPVAPAPPPVAPEADVPTFRRRPTLAALPVEPDKSPSQLGALPTGARSHRPTRSRETLTFMSPLVQAPSPAPAPSPATTRGTTPLFKAPGAGKSGDDKDESKDS